MICFTPPLTGKKETLHSKRRLDTEVHAVHVVVGAQVLQALPTGVVHLPQVAVSKTTQE